MNHWKKELTQAFAPPPPLRKQDFIRQLNPPPMGAWAFLLTQIGYIRKRVWWVSAGIFLIGLIGAALLSLDMLWVISALTPLLALTVISESGRSECHKMAELEMATRFSLRSVTMARLGILGVQNLILLGLLVPLGLWNNSLRPLAAGVYILTPFLLTTFLGLGIVRKFKGQEAMYICIGVTVFISVSICFSHIKYPVIYQENCLRWWIAGALALCIGDGKQYAAMINRTEDLLWSLS